MILKFQLMRHFDKSVCYRENTKGFFDSHFDGDNFEQKSVATERIILPLLGAALLYINFNCAGFNKYFFLKFPEGSNWCL